MIAAASSDSAALERPVLHLYFTDFCLGQHKEAEAFLLGRLLVFETFTLPSMRAQTVSPEGWAIIVNKGLPTHILRRLQAAVAPLGWADVVEASASHVGAESHVETSADWVAQKRAVWWHLLKKDVIVVEPLVLYSGIDSDDALATWYTERVQEVCRRLARFRGDTSMPLIYTETPHIYEADEEGTLMSASGISLVQDPVVEDGAAGQDCWEPCGQSSGLCPLFCRGEAPLCCKKGAAGANDAPECRMVEHGALPPTHHHCVAPAGWWGGTSKATSSSTTTTKTTASTANVTEYFVWGLDGLRWQPTGAGVGDIQPSTWGAETAPYLGLTIALPFYNNDNNDNKNRLPIEWRSKHNSVCKLEGKEAVNGLPFNHHRRCLRFRDKAGSNRNSKNTTKELRRPSYLYVRTAMSDSGIHFDTDKVGSEFQGSLGDDVAKAMGWSAVLGNYGINTKALESANAGLAATSEERLKNLPDTDMIGGKKAVCKATAKDAPGDLKGKCAAAATDKAACELAGACTFVAPDGWWRQQVHQVRVNQLAKLLKTKTGAAAAAAAAAAVTAATAATAAAEEAKAAGTKVATDTTTNKAAATVPAADGEDSQHRTVVNKALAAFYASCPAAATGASASPTSNISSRSWEEEWADRIARAPADKLRTRCETGGELFDHMLRAVEAVQAVGVQPWLVHGMAIGALRHHGFIDFGGGDYQTGFDDDPDFMLTQDGMAKAQRAFFAGGLRWVPALTTGEYVSRRCECGEATKTFFRDVGVDLTQPYGGHFEYADKVVPNHRWANAKPMKIMPMDVTPCLDWGDKNSCAHIFCWNHTAKLLADHRYGALMRVYRRDSIFPLREVPVYHATLPAAAHAEEHIKDQWGPDVLRFIKVKKTSRTGGSLDGAVYRGTRFPPMAIGHCDQRPGPASTNTAAPVVDETCNPRLGCDCAWFFASSKAASTCPRGDNSKCYRECCCRAAARAAALVMDFDVDIVIPSSMGAPGNVTGEAERSRTDDHSLFWVLTSIVRHAPWVRQIFVLVNGVVENPYKHPYKQRSLQKVQFVDRCLYMSPENCPTRNGFAVATMIHRLPELAEHFIMLEDDTMFGRPVTRGDFFAAPSGKPLVFQVRSMLSESSHTGLRIYITREGCSTLKLHV